MSGSAKACILSVCGTRLGSEEARLLKKHNPWGLILMERSCESPRQVRVLVEDIWNALDRECLVFIDQEGGRVQRLHPPGWPDFPPAAFYGRLFREEPSLGREAAYLGYWLIAAELEAMGICADCAPVLDLQIEGCADVIGDRAFDSDPLIVGELGRSALAGLAAGGVAGVIKHIPGHGRAEADSHEVLPHVRLSADCLEREMEPFRFLREAPMAMTAHIAYEAYDPGVAATVSKKVIGEVVRGHIGFEGLLISDDLGMKALGGGLSERTEAALLAGCDIVLYCMGVEGMEQIAEASTPLSDCALERAEAVGRVTAGRSFLDRDRVSERHARLLELMN